MLHDGRSTASGKNVKMIDLVALAKEKGLLTDASLSASASVVAQEKVPRLSKAVVPDSSLLSQADLNKLDALSPEQIL